MKKWIISVIALVLIVGGGIGLGAYITSRNNTATAVATLSFDGGAEAQTAQTSGAVASGARVVDQKNSGATLPTEAPKFQFVLNVQNKVLSVVCLNKSADIVLLNVDVNGQTIGEASISITNALIDSGFASVDVTTNSKNIFSLTISTNNTAQAEKIKDVVKQNVDKVFDQNGIFGTVKSAIVAQTQDMVQKYADVANAIGMDANQFFQKTEAEVLAMINEHSKKVEQVAGDMLASLKSSINNVFASLNVEELQTQLEQYVQQLAELENNPLASQFKEQIANIKNLINKCKQNLNSLLAEAQKQIDNLIKSTAETSKEILENLKSEYKQVIDDFKTILDQHKAEFEQNKDEVLAQINAWRESLEQNA